MRASWGLAYGGQHTSDQQQPRLPAQAGQLKLRASGDYLKAYNAACVFSSKSSRSVRTLYWYCWLMRRGEDGRLHDMGAMAGRQRASSAAVIPMPGIVRACQMRACTKGLCTHCTQPMMPPALTSLIPVFLHCAGSKGGETPPAATVSPPP